MNAADIAHDAVYRKMNGETVTPDSIKANLIADGLNDRQAATMTKMATALIPTVTSDSLRKWLAAKVA